MKIALLSIYRPGDKTDFNSGYGTGFDPGNSIKARLLAWARKSNEYLPLVNYGYAAAALKKAGHEVSLVSNQIPKDMDLVVLHASLIRHNEEMETLKKVRAETKSRICLIGPLATEWPHLFDEIADTTIIGDMESVFLNMKTLDDLPKGRYAAPAIKNLDDLPFPDWSIYDYHKFGQYPILKKKPTIFVQGSRSCPYKCNYCPYITSQKKYNIRSPENIIEELKHLKTNYGFQSVLFRDPVFSINKRWVQTLCAEMIKHKIDLEWACETRTDCLTEDLIDQMYDAGLRAIKVGIESSNHTILSILKRKPPELEHQARIVNYAEQKGIGIAAFYIVGLLDDTLESMEHTLKSAIELNTSFANFNLCTPLPGTEFYDLVKDRIFDHNLNHYDNYHPVFKTNFLTPEEILYYQEKSMVNYYFRIGFVKKQITHLLRK